jgi:tetratricopeptide (TPR) repeat protein
VFEGYREAREAAMRALELAPDLAEAHLRLSGVQRLHDWDWKGAEASTRRALELAPGSAEVLRSTGGLFHLLGRFDEAEVLFRRATEQVNTGGFSSMGLLYRSMGRLADAERAYRKAIELSPQRIAGHHVLAIILAEQGRDAEALAEAKLEPAEWARLTALAFVHFRAGRQAESEQALEQLEAKHATDSAYQIAANSCVEGRRGCSIYLAGASALGKGRRGGPDESRAGIPAAPWLSAVERALEEDGVRSVMEANEG